MHVLDNGVCVTCRPVAARAVEHVLVDGQCVTCPPVAARFDPKQLRDPGGEDGGRWIAGPGAAVSALKDTLKLAERIDLKDGETFGGSAKASDGSGDFVAVFARIDTPGGVKIRFGTVLPEDARKWRAADQGRTVELNEANVRQLREVIDGSPQAGRDSVKQYYADVRAAHAADLAPDDYPDPEAVIAEGTIRAGWGDVKWKLQLDADTGPEIPGITAPGAGWSLGLDIVPAGADPDDLRDSMYVDSVGRVKALGKALESLAGQAVAARAGTHAFIDGQCSTCSPTAVRAGHHFDPNEPRDPHSGKWTDGGAAASALKDVLKLAEKIDLGPDEKFLGSDRLNADGGSIRLALTEAHGVRALRLGIGGPGFGSANDDAGPWRGNRISVDEINAERKRLRAERDAAAAEIERLDADPLAGPKRKAAAQAKFDELDDMNLDEASPAGYTARLDPAAAGKLHDTLTRALAEGKAKQKELDNAYDNDLPEPPRPAQGYWTIAEGSVSGEWADVAWNVYIDDPSVGVEVHIGAVPPGESLEDLTGAEQAARLDPAEAQKLVRLLGKYTQS